MLSQSILLRVILSDSIHMKDVYMVGEISKIPVLLNIGKDIKYILPKFIYMSNQILIYIFPNY